MTYHEGGAKIELDANGSLFERTFSRTREAARIAMRTGQTRRCVNCGSMMRNSVVDGRSKGWQVVWQKPEISGMTRPRDVYCMHDVLCHRIYDEQQPWWMFRRVDRYLAPATCGVEPPLLQMTVLRALRVSCKPPPVCNERQPAW